jgi:signal peptidase I
MEPERAELPRKSIALLLGVLGPWGTGLFYLGQTRRALVWLYVPSVLLLASLAGLPWLGTSTFAGRALLFVLILVTFGSWLAVMVDTALIPEAKYQRKPPLWVAIYCTWGMLFTLGVRGFLVNNLTEAFNIPTGSMEPTLVPGDHVLLDKPTLFFRAPLRGEMIVFESPETPERDFVKRVIGLPGDTITIKRGHPWINGREVPHCKLGSATMPNPEGVAARGDVFLESLGNESYLTFYDETARSEEQQGPYVVAENEVWVLGDNRNNSYDSRVWFQGKGGGLPRANIQGRVLLRYWSVPEHRVNYARIGTAVAAPLLPEGFKDLQPALDQCLANRASANTGAP